MLQSVPCDIMVGAWGAGQHEADFVLLQYVRSMVPRAGFRSAVGHQLHAERRQVVVGGLLRIPDIELDMVRSLQGQKIMSRGNQLICYLRHGMLSFTFIASRQRSICCGVPVEIRTHVGRPNGARWRTITPCRIKDSVNSRAVSSLASGIMTKFVSDGTGLSPSYCRPSVSIRRDRAFISSDRCRNSLSSNAAMPAACASTLGSN